MRAPRAAALVVAALALAPPPQRAHAQQLTKQDCEFDILMAEPPADLDPVWRAFYPSVRFPLLQPLLRDGRWLEVLDQVRASFDQAAVLAGGPLATIANFRIHLDTTHAQVERVIRVPSRAALDKEREALRRVGPARFRAELRPDGRANLFRGSPPEIVLSDSDPPPLRRAVCYHAALERAVLDTLTQQPRTAASDLLSAKRALWADYFERGYSQLPWELLFNSRLDRSAADLDPPETQWVLAHPSVAVEVSGPKFQDLARHDAIALEPVGYIWYRNGYRDYFGISGVVVFTNGLGTGVGPFLHFGRVAKIGYVFPTQRRDAAGARRPDGALITVDLYKYLSDRAGQTDAVLKRLKESLTQQ